MTRDGTVLFNPSDPDLQANPYPTYRRMRDESPAWLSPEGVWYFTRFNDCWELFRSPAVSYDGTRTNHFQRSLSTDPEERARQLDATQRAKTILDVDPPDHTRLRSLMNRAFAAPAVEAMRTGISELVDTLLDDFDGPEVELVEAYSSLLPILVICEMMGVPAEERDLFVDIGNDQARAVDPEVPIEEKLAAGQRRREYMVTLIERRRRQPADDLITRLVEATEDGRMASEDELVSNTGTLLAAGFETTTNLISNAVYQFIRHPEELARLLEEPELVASAIEEVLRFDPPTQLMRPRAIVAPTQIGPAVLEIGDAVVPVLGAANHDPDEFPEPERFDITRSPNRHMGFGVGRHLCVGAALARMESQIGVLRLFQRYPDLALSATESPRYRPNLTLRGFAKLPIVL